MGFGAGRKAQEEVLAIRAESGEGKTGRVNESEPSMRLRQFGVAGHDG